MSAPQDRWLELERLFNEALAHRPDERSAFLDAACTDAELRAEVDRLLAAEAGAETRLRRVVEEGAVLAALTEDAVAESEVIGAYRLVRAIGRGGMGAVWLAERADAAYQDRVAIKIIRADAARGGLIRRFLAERQILANLKHPNIARLLDGGTTADGRPYLVMEYIEGEPIDLYCARLRLDVDARIRLIREVCAAIQFAHANLVVHRDIKPGNILVTADGVPKLLDFGIAKILDSGTIPQRLTETGTGTRLMTPAYASPEQIRGLAVTTASDVYSLAVVLYELLVGRLPYRVDSDLPHVLAEAILTTQPERPSTVVTPPRLRRQLAGDLDTILLVALRKEPERRYGSVEQFAGDLQRHQDGLPVIARADTWGYRAGKFVHRNRGAVSIGVTTFFTLAIFAFNTAVQARRIALERDAANREREKAERVTEFLVDVFEASDPNNARGVDVTAREILAEGGRQAATELADQPELQAATMEAIGRVYRALGELDSAASFLETARDRRFSALGPNSIDYARSLSELGLLARIREQYDDAERYHTEALALRRKLLGEQHADVGKSLNSLAVVYHDRGELQRAESLYIAAVDLDTRLFGREHAETATALNNLANLLTDLGRYDDAIALQRETLEIRRRLHAGKQHMDVAYSLNNLASVLEYAGRYAEAEPFYNESLDIRRTLLPEGHASILIVMNNLGGLRLRTGDHAGAAEILKEVVRLRRARGESGIALATPLSNLAVAQQRLGHYQEAMDLSMESTVLTRQVLGPRSVNITFPMNTTAGALYRLGRYAEAERVHREIVDIRREAYGEKGHPNLVFSLEGLAAFLLDRGRPAAAEPLATEAVTVGRRVFTQPHAYLAEALLALGRTHVELGRLAQAVPLLRESLEMRKTTGPSQPSIAQTQSLLGRALLASDDSAEARVLLTTALAYIRPNSTPDSRWLSDTQSALARLRSN